LETVKNIPLHHIHQALGAKILPFAGFNMPILYSNLIQEHNAVRQGVGLFDVSHMGEFVLRGPNALELIQRLCTNDAAALTDGKVQYTCMTNPNGGIVDDLLVYRWDANEYYMVVNASNIEKDWDWLVKNNTNGVVLENISDTCCLFALQGPKALATLEKLTTLPLAQMDNYEFVAGMVAGVEDVLVSTTGYTGAGGFELYVWNSSAEKVWNALMDAGEAFGIMPVGLGARDTLRTEMGYCLYGNDIDDGTSPIEAGLGWITKFNKTFTASHLHAKIKADGPTKKLVGLEILDRGIARQHYEILDNNGLQIGTITSGTQSPSLGKAIALGYVAAPFAKIGTEVFVQVRNNRLRAIISTPPFVKKNE
jgi:aminomethyltransferase